MAFLAALASTVGAAALLALSLWDYTSSSADGPVAALLAADSASMGATASNDPIRFRGVLPQSLDGEGLAMADEAHPTDVSFSSTDDPNSGVVARYWAWVASPHAALDALNGAQLRRLLDGSDGPAAVGGLGAGILVAAAASDI